MNELKWQPQADVWLFEPHALDTDQSRKQVFINAAEVAFDNGFLFIRPRNERKTHVVPAAGVQRIEFPPVD